MHRSRGSVSVALVVGTLLLAPSLLATSAAAAEPDAPPALDPEVRARFLEVWTERLEQPGYVQARLAQGAAPLQDEFQALPRAHQLVLAHDLLGWMMEQDPALEARIHPPAQPSSWSAQEAMATLMLHAVAFDGSALREAVAPPEDAAAPPAALSVQDPLTGEPLADADALRAALEDRRAVEPAPAPDAVPLEAVAAIAPRPPPERADAQPPAPHPVEPPELPTLPRDLPAPVLPEFAPPLAPPLSTDVVGDPLVFAQALTYVACGHLLAGPTDCSEAVPFGTPIVLDLDASVGPDVAVLLAPAALPSVLAAQPTLPPTPEGLLAALQATLDETGAAASAPGLAVTLRIGTLPDSGDLPCNVHVGPDIHFDFGCLVHLPSGAPALLEQTVTQLTGPQDLPAEVWVEYRIADPTQDVHKLLRLGVDGTTTKLPEVTTATLRLRDLPQLLAGRVEGTLNLTFDQPGDDLGLFVEVSDLQGGAPVDPTAVEVRMTPVPDLGLDFEAALDGTDFRGVLEATERPLLTVTYRSETSSPASTTMAEAVIDLLPARVAVEYQRMPDGTRLHYDASDVIELITAQFQRVEPGETLAGTLAIHELPTVIDLFLRTQEQEGVLEYDASSVVPLVEGSFSRTVGGITTLATAEVHDIPASFDLAWDTAADPSTLTWDASDPLGPILFTLSSGPGRLAVEASVDSIPRFVEVHFTGDLVRLDARDGATAPPASGTIGPIHVAFATDGAFLGALPSEDHAYFQQLADGTTRADVLYTGLQFAEADLRNGAIHVDVVNADPRFVRVLADLPGAFIAGFIDSISSHVTIDVDGDLVAYDSHDEVIDQIHIDFSDKGAPAFTATLDVFHIPSTIALTLDLDQQAIAYTAGDEVHQVVGVASVPTPLGVFAVEVDVQGIPTAWTLAFPDGGFGFDAPDGVDSVRVHAQNYAAPPTPCAGAPNYLCATLDLPDNLFDAEFRLVDVTHAELENLDDGVHVHIGAGGGQAFVASGFMDITPELRATLSATIDSLPESIDLVTGPVITYEADDNFDLELRAAVGHPATLPGIPEPPMYPLGASVRGDAAFAAFKVAAKLTGLPTFLRLDTANADFELQDFRPKSTQLTLDADLSPAGDTPRIDALVVVDNVVAAVGQAQDLHVTFTPSEQGEVKRTQATYDSFTALGPINATVLFGVDQLLVEVSNVPTHIDVDLRLGPEETLFNYNASQAIDRIFAGFALTSDPTLDLDAAIELQDVPASIVLTIGRNEVGPTVDYTASDSTLDVALSIAATLFEDDVRARILAGITDLGAHVTVRQVPGETSTSEVPNDETDDPCDTIEVTSTASDGLELTSTPPTPLLFVEVWVEAHPVVEDHGTECFTFIADFLFNWSYQVDLDVDIERLSTYIEGLDTMLVKPGFPLVIEGTYDEFGFGWDDLLVVITAQFHADLDACWFVNDDLGNWCFDDIFSFSPGLSFDIEHVWFHMANAHLGDWIPLQLQTPEVCLVVGILQGTLSLGTVQLSPDPSHGAMRDGFRIHGLGSPSDDGGGARWYVMPFFESPGSDDPFLPTWLAGLVIFLLAESEDRDIDLDIDPSVSIGEFGLCNPF